MFHSTMSEQAPDTQVEYVIYTIYVISNPSYDVHFRKLY